jgi:hypothetical protein
MKSSIALTISLLLAPTIASAAKRQTFTATAGTFSQQTVMGTTYVSGSPATSATDCGVKEGYGAGYGNVAKITCNTTTTPATEGGSLQVAYITVVGTVTGNGYTYGVRCETWRATCGILAAGGSYPAELEEGKRTTLSIQWRNSNDGMRSMKSKYLVSSITPNAALVTTPATDVNGCPPGADSVIGSECWRERFKLPAKIDEAAERAAVRATTQAFDTNATPTQRVVVPTPAQSSAYQHYLKLRTAKNGTKFTYDQWTLVCSTPGTPRVIGALTVQWGRFAGKSKAKSCEGFQPLVKE